VHLIGETKGIALPAARTGKQLKTLAWNRARRNDESVLLVVADRDWDARGDQTLFDDASVMDHTYAKDLLRRSSTRRGTAAAF